MNRPIHIVGHGLAGCVLALTLYRRQVPFSMTGLAMQGEASMASSGLIAPVTGRRYVKAWRIDEFIPKALDFYKWSESLLGGTYFFPVEIVRFLSNPEAKRAWEKRLSDPEYASYISNIKYAALDALQRPYGILTGGYRLDTPGWIHAVHQFLIRQGVLSISSTMFDAAEDPHATIIYATGALDKRVATGIIPNKGESLIVRMPQWKITQAIKDEVFIIPLEHDHRFWVGSFYQPGEENPFPTEEGRDQLLSAVRKMHQGPVDILSHFAGIRPTVDDRRPLIGLRPGHAHQYLFNGMGTKGTSLAPFWADQLVSHLRESLPLPTEVSPARYA